MKYRHAIKEIEDFKLPKTRKEQLKDILHNDFSFIVDLCLLDLLFSLPLYVLIFLEYSMISTLSELSFVNVFPVIFYMGLIAIPLFMIKGLAKGANYGLLIKRIFNEGCILIPSFIKMIKNNFIHYASMYLLLGISYFISSSISIYFIYLDASSIIKGLGIGVSILLFMITYVSANYFMNLDNCYELKFIQGLRNANSFTFISFLGSLIYFILAIVLPITLMILSIWSLIIAFVVYAFFYNGLMMLIASLFSISRFDLYINKDNYPTYYKKGLLKEDNVCQN